MERAELERMNNETLWRLHLEIAEILRQKLQQEKIRLEQDLKLLQTPMSGRRPYPPVSPKYRNPDQPSETWSGRGKQPRWLVVQLKTGRRIEDFRIHARKKQGNSRRAEASAPRT